MSAPFPQLSPNCAAPFPALVAAHLPFRHCPRLSEGEASTGLKAVTALSQRLTTTHVCFIVLDEAF